MSVRVNLLPKETFARQAAARQRLGVGVAFLALLAVLAGVYLFQLNRVDDARTELAEEQERVEALRAEVQALSEFEALRQRREQVHETATTTLQGEIGVAGILQDVAAVMPADAQIDSLSLNLGEPSEDDVTGVPTVGGFNATGRTLTSHAPGVERLLLSLDKIASFVDIFVNSSSLDDPDDDIASFSVEGQIGTEVLTGRYDDGLPEELR